MAKFCLSPILPATGFANLCSGPWPAPIPRRQVRYGRALGRVLAHELYHIFAHTRTTRLGACQEAYSVGDLLNDVFQFQEKESRLLRENRPATGAEQSVGTR